MGHGDFDVWCWAVVYSELQALGRIVKGYLSLPASCRKTEAHAGTTTNGQSFAFPPLPLAVVFFFPQHGEKSINRCCAVHHRCLSRHIIVRIDADIY